VHEACAELRELGLRRRPPARWAHLADGWVDLAATERLVRGAAGVRDARAYVDPARGPHDAVVAALVLSEPTAVAGRLRRELLGRLAAHPGARVPARIAVLPALPDTAGRTIAADGREWEALLLGPVGSGSSEPGDGAERRLYETVARVRGTGMPDATLSWFDLPGPACERVPAVIHGLAEGGLHLPAAPLVDPFIDLRTVARSLSS
jgi:hypothetical protein